MGIVAIDIVNVKNFFDFLNEMQVNSSLQIRSARELACDDVSRLYDRVNLCRRPLAARSSANPYSLLITRRAKDVSMNSKDALPCLFKTVTVDQCMMIRGSKNCDHYVGTGSANLDFLSHNRVGSRLFWIHRTKLVSNEVDLRMEVMYQQAICFGFSYIDALLCRFQSGPRK